MVFLLALALPSQAPPASAHFPARNAGRATVDTDLISRPAGIGADDFAAQIAGQEGLSSWNGTGSAMQAGDGLEAVAVYGGDGRRVMVLYRPEPGGRRGAVCRVRIAATATKEDWTAGRAWCAQRLLPTH